MGHLFGSNSSVPSRVGGEWKTATKLWMVHRAKKRNFAEEEGRNVGLEMTEKAGLHSRVSVGLLSACHVFPAHQSSLTTRTFDVKYLKVCELPGADFCKEDGA